MVPFLASPRKGPHIQMAHYSSIWLCILHKILFQCLTTSISNTGVTIFHEGPPPPSPRCTASEWDLVFGPFLPIPRAELGICFNLSTFLSPLARSAAFICIQVWCLTDVSLCRGSSSSVFFSVHLCVIKVTAWKIPQRATDWDERGGYWSRSSGTKK